MLKASLIEGGSGRGLYIAEQNGHLILVSQTHAQMDGRFKSKTLVDTGVVVVTEPSKGGSIVLTDFILTSDKTLGAVVSVRLTDDTNTIPLMVADMSDAPVNLASSLAGKWEGWRDARLELVIEGGVNPTATLAAGYYKNVKSKLYADWDSQR